MTPTPEQIEKMAHDFVRSNECEVMDDYSAHEATYKAGAHAMQSLMDAQAAKVQCLVEALEKIEGAFDNGKERRHLKDVFSGKCEDVCQPCAQKRAREALTKWRSP